MSESKKVTAETKKKETTKPATKTNVEPKEEVRGSRKVRTGYVVSDKMEKTIVVELEDRKKHTTYGKIVRTTSKVKAHDQEESAGIGDLVRIMETRPLSATKRWRLVTVIEKAK